MSLIVTLWAWVVAHYVIVWPVVTAVASLAYTLLDEDTRIHAVFSTLASLGLDLPKLLAMLQKVFAGPSGGSSSGGGSSNVATIPPKLPPPPPVAVRLALCALLALLFGCLSSAPTVPVTPANQAQVETCQSIAGVHNGVVIGDFVFGGGSTTLGIVGAALPSSNLTTKNDLAIGAAAAAGVAAIGAGVAGYTAQEFSNGNCSSVVGALPAAARDGGL